MGELLILSITGTVSLIGYCVQTYLQWVKDLNVKKSQDSMMRKKELLSKFYWPIYMRLVEFDISKRKDKLKEIEEIIKKELGNAAPKTTVAEPTMRFLKHVSSPDKFVYPQDMITAFKKRTFELQKEYNDLFFSD
jgi:hypothetical protein